MFNMLNEACALCLTTNTRKIIINNTCLQLVYEKLADLKIDNISCWMCFICHRRLLQCHQLWQLAEQTRSVLVGSIVGVQEDKIEAIFASKKSLLELSPSKLMNICIESTVDVGEELERNVKRDPSNDVEAQHADTDDRTARRGSDEQSYKQISCDEDSVQDIKDIFEAKDDQLLEFVQSECKGITEEYVQEYMTADRSFEETTTGLSFDTENEEQTTGIVVSQDLTSSEETSRYKKRFCCDICQRKFSRRGQLKEHLNIHTGEKPYSCDICQRKFSQRRFLTVHHRFHTDEKPCVFKLFFDVKNKFVA